MKRASFVLVGILLVALLSLPAFAGRGKINFRIDNPSPGLQMNDKGETAVTMPETGRGGGPGQPALPYKVVRLAIPPEAVASSVRVQVTHGNINRLPGEFDVEPAPPIRTMNGGAAIWGSDAGRIVNGRDTGVYGGNGMFPKDWSEVSQSIGELRRYRFVTVTVFPVRFKPSENALFHAGRIDIEVSFEVQKPQNVRRLNDCGQELLARRVLANFDDTLVWYSKHCLARSDGPGGIAIITTEDIQDGSELLEDYMEMRSGQGHDIDVYTEADWDVSTGGLLDDRSDRIRHWLQENYESLDLGYVILIGNPDPYGDFLYGVPMKKCVTTSDPEVGEMTSLTDFYFADLTGTWDADGNGTVCEWGVDELDLMPEVFVGRIPVYSDGPMAVDEMLAKIIEYEQESESGDVGWRRRVMFPSSIYFFKAADTPRSDGASVAEWAIREELRPRGMLWTTLYEIEGIKPSIFENDFPLTSPNVVDQWVRGYGLVFLMGHGSSGGVYRSIWTADSNGNNLAEDNEISQPAFFSVDMPHMISDSPPAFVIHAACSNGVPSDANNLGYTLLRRGAIATVSASDLALGWYWPNQVTEEWKEQAVPNGDMSSMNADYASNLFEGMGAGEAFGTTIANTANTYVQGSSNLSWYQKTLFNLYGDPLVRMVMCREDADCEVRSDCWGEAHCEDGFCFAGEPVVCEPTEECETMVCEEGLGCVPSAECLADEDAGVSDGGADAGADTDGDSGTPEVTNFEDLSAKTGCSFAPWSFAEISLIELVTRLF
jgi:hypothetical protein